jgi:ABC-type anion transport system duplicated permease subunit
MNLLKSLLRPPALIGIGVGVVGVGALFAFHPFGQMLVIILLLILAIALLVVLVNLRRQLRAAGAADQIQKTISHQADRDIERSRVSRRSIARSPAGAAGAPFLSCPGTCWWALRVRARAL